MCLRNSVFGSNMLMLLSQSELRDESNMLMNIIP